MSDMSIEIPQQPTGRKRSNAVFRLPRKLIISPEMLADNWIETVQKKCREVYYRSLSDPRLYACGKLAERFLVGTGVLLRSGQPPIGDGATINNFFVSIRSEEDAKRLIELGREAARLPAGNADGATALVAGANPEPDQERCVVVAAELHQDP